jgi:hypothetical protein
MTTLARLRDLNSVFIDVSTVSMISNPDMSRLLHENFRKSGGREWLFREAGKRPEIMHLLELLKRAVVYDVLAVDELAFEHHSLWKSTPRKGIPGVGDLIQPVPIPSSVYAAVAEELEQYVHTLQSPLHGLEYSLELPSTEAEEYYVEQAMHDFPKIARRFGDLFSYSGPVLPRSLLYLELSRVARVPILVSPQKKAFVESTKQTITTEALTFVERLADQRLLGEVRAHLQSTVGKRIEMPDPPLGELILRYAEQNDLSLYDSVIAIRESAPGRDFRRWLAELQRLIADGSRHSLLAAQAKISELNVTLDLWKSDGRAENGVGFVRRKLALEAIPGFGWLLKLIGKGEINIDDPILDPRGSENYLAFISSWYTEQPVLGASRAAEWF